MIAVLLSVAGGGAIGALCRYLLFLLIPSSSFPLTTLSINVLGSFSIGVFSILATAMNTSEWLRVFIQVGILGGFTTFSTFSLDAINIWQDQRITMAGIYVFLSVFLCLVGVMAGTWLGRMIQHSVQSGL